MLPANNVSKHAIFRASSKGTATETPLTERLKLTGDKLTWIAGFSTVNCHHGTNKEIAIRTKVEIPAANAIKLILFFIITALVYLNHALQNRLPTAASLKIIV